MAHGRFSENIIIGRVLANCMRLAEFVRHPDWKPLGVIKFKAQVDPTIFAEVPHPLGKLEIFIETSPTHPKQGWMDFQVKDEKGRLTHRVFLHAGEHTSALTELRKDGFTQPLRRADSLALGLILRTVLPQSELPGNLSSPVRKRFAEFIRLVRQRSDPHPD